MKKIFFLALLIFSVTGFMPTVNNSISAFDLCDVKGYTILDCTYTKRKGYDDDLPEDVVRLENGMIFRISGFLPQLSGGRAVVFARSIRIHNEDALVYKLYIDDKDRIYSANRLR